MAIAIALAFLPAAASAQAPDLEQIFFDGFESGTPGAWHQFSHPLAWTVSSTAAMSGLYGLEVLVDGSQSVYLQDDSETPGSSIRNRDASYFHVSFRFDPNGFDPGEASGHFRTRIFIAFQGDPQRRLFALVLRRRAGQFALMARVRQDNGVEVETGFHDISDEPHLVEAVWHRSRGADAENGLFRLSVDGSPVAALGRLDNFASGVDFTRLGALSVKAGASGTLHLDDFRTARDLAAPRTQLVINEVDYDQGSVDSHEFVEIYNPGPAEVVMQGGQGFVSLVSVDGSLPDFTGGHTLHGTLAPGGYLVAAGTSVVVPPGVIRRDFVVGHDVLPDNAPSGVVLLYETGTECLVLDAVSYEGSLSAPVRFLNPAGCGIVDFAEGTPLASEVADGDTGPASLIRRPNGVDTNDAASDWSLTTTPTPGAPNVLTP